MKALTLFSHHIARDVNNIFQLLLSCTDFALMDKSEDSPDLPILREIESNIHKGAKYIEQFLVFGGNIKPQYSSQNLNSIIITAENLLRNLIPDFIDIQLDLAEDLLRIDANQSQCEQILMNLCVNAKDAITENGRLTIGTDNVLRKDAQALQMLDFPPEDYVCLSVSDNGRGIPPSIMDRIYEPFFTTKAKKESTGLGLSMVYAIVKQHNGYLECTSKEGKGTTFKVYVPALETA
jgi:signal transduction histidine kinase